MFCGTQYCRIFFRILAALSESFSVLNFKRGEGSRNGVVQLVGKF